MIVLTCLIIIFTINNYKDSLAYTIVVESDKRVMIPDCGCQRTIQSTTSTSDNNTSTTSPSSINYTSITSLSSINYTSTTCSKTAYLRGSDQHVVSFSYYGDPTTPHHKSKQYYAGIKENLSTMSQFYPGWVMRLYHDLDHHNPLLGELCDLACNNNNLDLCNVKHLPGSPFVDAHNIFPMNWKFFPTIDKQVISSYDFCQAKPSQAPAPAPAQLDGFS